MPTPNPFDSPNPDSIAAHDAATREEVLHRLNVFIRERIITRHGGKLPTPLTIAARLLVLTMLLNPADAIPLARMAQELGCSRAWLSAIGLDFADTLGIRARWQRINLRQAYAKRARGVHGNAWQSSSKTDRAKVRAAKKKL